ncbi:hypothetical protein L1765_14660 [Microaerobacter geothermalis]|uniref:hypothetical protein n=1 Tax=Microaerobacter geothermalis TaxID=674972 RepID=UPI001F2FE9B2|nr:hypothetical protein [Microaerobacter geothermalis]MCF6095202.1 hypothetical protein [Microaerobacter geothermalis]
MEKCIKVKLTVPEQPSHGGIPGYVKESYWRSAKGTAILCRYSDRHGEIIIEANNLLPLGVYTAWFVTDTGPYPAASRGATYTSDGFDPNRVIVNKNGQLQYYIAHLNFDPFKGVPIDSTVHKIKSIVLAFHTDGTTHGTIPGPHVEHLTGMVNV